MRIFLLISLSFALSAEATEICDRKMDFPSSKGSPESQLKKALNLTDEEAAIRMIMAETAASGCESLDVALGIAQVIKNRVEAKRFGKTFRAVVFQKSQFRSTTGSCDVARRDLFLCPSKNPALYQLAREAFASTERQVPREAYSYFFFKHFDSSRNCKKWKGVVPSWASESRRLYPVGLKIDPTCMGFYKHR